MEGLAWPLHGIHVRTAHLDLRVMTEADLPTLWSLLPDDLELNPHAPWPRATTRGRGLGKQMRAAVLALAFGPLRAAAAISSAVVDNASSLGVSRALGYRDTHRSLLEHSGETLQHVRLERATWDASGHARGIVLSGVEPALPFFGLDPSEGPRP